MGRDRKYNDEFLGVGQDAIPSDKHYKMGEDARLERLAVLVEANTPLVREHNLGKVLLVDDDEDFRDAMKEHITGNFGDSIDLAITGNGNEAVELYDKDKPGLILLDQMLPGRSGFLVLLDVKTDEKEKKVAPCLM